MSPCRRSTISCRAGFLVCVHARGSRGRAVPSRCTGRSTRSWHNENGTYSRCSGASLVKLVCFYQGALANMVHTSSI